MVTVKPSGTVTFLFTDIEGSTQRWEAEPEVMRVALAEHDVVLRRRDRQRALVPLGEEIAHHEGHAAPPGHRRERLEYAL